MVLCEVAIAVRVSPPSATHMSRQPSRTQPPPSEGEEELHSPAGNPHLGGGTLQCLPADLGDLADDELCQLMEDLCWEVTLHELNAPPEAPHHALWKPSRKQGSQSR